MLLGDTVVVSVHVLFDESIPKLCTDYFRELDEATVKCDPEERRVSDFDWLEGSTPSMMIIYIRLRGWLYGGAL